MCRARRVFERCRVSLRTFLRIVQEEKPMSTMRPLAATISAVVGLMLCAPAAFAGGFYPTQDCVASKLKAASKFCQTDLKAWAKWDTSQDASGRDATINA